MDSGPADKGVKGNFKVDRLTKQANHRSERISECHNLVRSIKKINGGKMAKKLR